MKKLAFALITTIVLSGCQATNGFQEFYNPIVDTNHPFAKEHLEFLPEGGSPALITTNDAYGKVGELQSKHFILLGESSFTGPKESLKGAIDVAKKIGATAIVVQESYDETRTSNNTMFIPQTSTTYSNGTIGTTPVFGTSTTTTTQAVNYTTSVDRYAYLVGYMAKSNAPCRFCVTTQDLIQDTRSRIGRNTGAFVSVVLEDGPAFLSNLMVGDVIIEADGQLIKDASSFADFSSHLPSSTDEVTLKIIRGTTEKSLVISDLAK